MASSFSDFFEAATNHKPFDYKRRLATEVCADGPKSLATDVPTAWNVTVASRSRSGH